MGGNKPYAWGKRNERLEIIAENDPKNYSLCLAITKTGPICAQIMEKSYNQFSFGYFMRKLLEILKKNNKLDEKKTYFFMDNLSSHKTAHLNDIFRNNGMKIIYNATHNPDMNPIECIFNTLKTKVYSETLKNK